MPRDPSATDRHDIAALLASQARRRPATAAIRCGGKTISREAFECMTLRVAGALRARGIGRGDRVAFLGEPSGEYVAGYLGAVRAGACAVPLPDAASPPALGRMFADADPRVVFASRAFAQALPAGGDDVRVALDFQCEGWLGFEAVLEAGAGTPSAGTVAADDPFNLLYSSGTTGRPKGIVQSHAMRAHHVQRMGRLGLDGEAVTLISTPLCSNATWISLLPTLVLGGTVVLERSFDTRAFLERAGAEGVTHALLVPAQIRRLLAEARFEHCDLPAYQATLSTGAPLPAATKQEVLDRWPGNLIEIYGQTEGGCVSVLDVGAHPDKLDSVGRPAEGVEIRLVNERGHALPAGAVGEVCGRGAGMMTGYHGRPDLTAALTWRDEAGKVFFRSGDLGRLDEDGFLHLVGRVKDVIISGGQNVHASDLEAVLLSHAAVAEVAVVGVSSERWGETPYAVVVPTAGAALASDDLLRWANEQLGRHQRISGLVFRDSLPRTALGKIRKRDVATWIETEGEAEL